jgi:ABC-type sugar transport system ATPase subunit
MAAIETTGLTKRFGSDVLAVDDVDLTVEEGEIFGFLGPNGAGKSTTIDMLLDYVRPTAGSASVLGHDAQTNTAAIHRRIGILPDDYGLYDRLSGYEHLEYAIDLKDATDDPDDLLDRVGLDATAAARAVGGYSTGMAQRLVLAIALVGVVGDGEHPLFGLVRNGLGRRTAMSRTEKRERRGPVVLECVLLGDHPTHARAHEVNRRPVGRREDGLEIASHLGHRIRSLRGVGIPRTPVVPDDEFVLGFQSLALPVPHPSAIAQSRDERDGRGVRGPDAIVNERDAVMLRCRHGHDQWRSPA